MLSIVSQNINIVILQIWKLIAAASMDNRHARSATVGDKSIEDIARMERKFFGILTSLARIVDESETWAWLERFVRVEQNDEQVPREKGTENDFSSELAYWGEFEMCTGECGMRSIPTESWMRSFKCDLTHL